MVLKLQESGEGGGGQWMYGVGLGVVYLNWCMIRML